MGSWQRAKGAQPPAEDIRRAADHRAALRARIEGKTARVGIVGLGHVGLPLARAFADDGFAVLGFDTDPAKVARLGRGESYIGHITEEIIARMRLRDFEATDRFKRLDEPDAVIICVPTPKWTRKEAKNSARSGSRVLGAQATVLGKGAEVEYNDPHILTLITIDQHINIITKN